MHPATLTTQLPLLLILLATLAGCQPGNDGGSAETVNIPASPAQITSFQTRLKSLPYTELGASAATSSSAEENTLISVFDLTQAVAMIGWGARGDTAAELATALSLPQTQIYWASIFQSVASSFKIAPGLNLDSQFWGQARYPFSLGFLDALDKGHTATTEQPDFVADLGGETFIPIAAWATDDSNQLLNAETFDWESPRNRTRILAGSRISLSARFDAAAYSEQSGIFSDLNDRFWQMPMLRFNGSFDSFENDKLRAVALPLSQNNGIRLLLLTPKQGMFSGIIDDLDNQVASLLPRLQPTAGDWWLPTFALSDRGERSGRFQSMGANRAFSEEEADFSGINGDGYLYLKEIEQRSQLELTAAGVNASSVTLARAQATLSEPLSYIPGAGSGFVDSSSDFTLTSPTINLEVCISPPAADALPFILLLIDQSQQTPLFASKILNPNGISADAAYLGRTSDCLPTFIFPDLPLYVPPGEVRIISAGNTLVTPVPIITVP
tara:strand:+ start:9232 stop:10725 length:1494 start_codon:yes stop_codon:yes gene_type:complete